MAILAMTYTTVANHSPKSPKDYNVSNVVECLDLNLSSPVLLPSVFPRKVHCKSSKDAVMRAPDPNLAIKILCWSAFP